MARQIGSAGSAGGLGCRWCSDHRGCIVLRRTVRHDAERGRHVCLPARSVFPALRISLWLDSVLRPLRSGEISVTACSSYVISAALIFCVLTVAGVFRLRVKRPDAPRPYRTLGYPVVPGLYMLGGEYDSRGSVCWRSLWQVVARSRIRRRQRALPRYRVAGQPAGRSRKALRLHTYPGRTHALVEGPGTAYHLYSLLARFLGDHVAPGPAPR